MRRNTKGEASKELNNGKKKNFHSSGDIETPNNRTIVKSNLKLFFFLPAKKFKAEKRGNRQALLLKIYF